MNNALTYGIILIVLVFAGSLIFEAANAFHSERFNITVTDKSAVPRSRGGYKYLIFTTGTTCEIVDSLVWWRFDSSDVYGRIEKGKTYRVTGQGYRIPFLSMYQNIVEIQDASQFQAATP